MKSTRTWYVDEVLTCKAELQSGQSGAGGETGKVKSGGYEASVQGHFGMTNRRLTREMEALQEWMERGGGASGKLGQYNEELGMMVAAGGKKMSKALIEKTTSLITSYNRARQRGSKNKTDFSQSYLKKYKVDFGGISKSTRKQKEARVDYTERIAALAKKGDFRRKDVYKTISDIIDFYGDD